VDLLIWKKGIRRWILIHFCMESSQRKEKGYTYYEGKIVMQEDV